MTHFSGTPHHRNGTGSFEVAPCAPTPARQFIPNQNSMARTEVPVFPEYEQLDSTEQFFVESVLTAVREVRERSGTTMTSALFDVDGTLIPVDEDMIGDDAGASAKVRQGLPVLLNQLRQEYPGQVDVGLMTTHCYDRNGNNRLDCEAPNLFGENLDMFNSQMAFSSHKGRFPELEAIELNGDRPKMLAIGAQVVQPGVLLDAKSRMQEPDAFDWYDTKTAITAELLTVNPDRSFVIVDDLPWAGALQHDRVEGVYLPPQLGGLYGIEIPENDLLDRFPQL